MTVDPSGAADTVARGRFVLGEMTSALEWLFDDGVVDDRDAQLARVADAHRDDPESADALAGALDDYAALAAQHQKELQGLGGFDTALIDEATHVATSLRQTPSTPQAPSPETRRALAFRNRLLTLLDARVNKVRAAARFVFRHYPDIVREATSVYERRRRAAARRAAAKQPAPPPA
jgi:hypothetical protein